MSLLRRLPFLSSPPTVGGQAVIEGVMMRSPNAYTVAVRLPDGRIEFKGRPLKPLSERSRIYKVPVIRGAASLFHMLYLGMDALSYSADVAMAAETAAAEKVAAGKVAKGEHADASTMPQTAGPAGSVTTARKSSRANRIYMGFSLVLAVVLGLALFLWLPLVITTLLFEPPESWKDVLLVMHRPQAANTFWFNLVDGLVKLAIFIGYISVLTAWKDFRRVFQYHGAEHKTIYAFENNEPLTVENARRYSTLHPRCGTSFLFVVLMISIVVFTAVRSDSFVVKFGSRIVLIPVIAGIGYELIKWSSRHMKNPFCRAFILPGLWMQRLTTKEPTDDMIEVAVRALQGALELETQRTGAAPEGTPASAQAG